MEHEGGKGAFDLRRDPCVHSERDTGAAPGPRRLPSATRPPGDHRVAVAEHHHHHDRPSLISQPDLSTSRPVHEDYFGRGADNASFFYIPIDIPGGTGPNRGRFG